MYIQSHCMTATHYAEVKVSMLSPVLLQRDVHFWFATGGAGFCLSRKLAEKMAPWAR